SRKERLDRELVHVAGVDAGEQRFGQVRRRFAAESSGDEVADRLVGVVGPPRNEELGRHPRLAARREQPRAEKGADLRGDPKDRACGKRVQPAVPLDERQPRRPGRHEAVRNAKVGAQTDAFGLLRQQRVWTAVDGEAVDLLAEDQSAGTRPALEKQERLTTALKLERCREARNATSDDY